jgi:hypothetical protein
MNFALLLNIIYLNDLSLKPAEGKEEDRRLNEQASSTKNAKERMREHQTASVSQTSSH